MKVTASKVVKSELLLTLLYLIPNVPKQAALMLFFSKFDTKFTTEVLPFVPVTAETYLAEKEKNL